ncbi:MAG: head GIN domain-containing protein [Bacteroidales bacterium]
MNKHLILLVITALIFFPGYAYSEDGLPSEERKVSEFDGLVISVPGEIFLVQGPAQRLIVEGTERVLGNLITEVKNGQLTIRTPSRWNFRRGDELRVYITMTELKNISLSGSARVFAESPFRCDKLSVNISGSGRVEIEDFASTELNVNISGSGRLKLGGSQSLEMSKIVISGSGRLESETLPVQSVEATISGSGRCYVHAASDLNVRISGSGRVIYTGNPLIDARISGSGRVVNAN